MAIDADEPSKHSAFGWKPSPDGARHGRLAERWKVADTRPLWSRDHAKERDIAHERKLFADLEGHDGSVSQSDEVRPQGAGTGRE